jgi:hypothetical protein
MNSTTLLLLQGEVDQVRVRWAHGRDHGDPPRQPPRHVAVVVPDLLEAHPVRHFPNNGVVVVVVVNGDRRHRRFVLGDDLHVPPESVVVEDHAGGYPVPVVGGKE